MKVERAAAVAQAIRQQIPLKPDWLALEYGCGTGLLSFALQPYLKAITLADSAPGMLDVLSAKIAHAGIANMTPLLLDLEQDSSYSVKVDFIYTLMTMHHVQDVQQVLSVFYNLLNPGGWIGISDLDREDGTFHSAGFTGHQGFDRQDLTELLIRTGFTRLSFSTPYTIRRGADALQQKYPLFLAVGYKSLV